MAGNNSIVTKRHITIFLVASIISLIIGVMTKTDNSTSPKEVIIEQTLSPNILYGLEIDSFEINKGTIQKNEFLSDILSQFRVPYQTIHNLSEECEDIYDVRRLRAGKDYMILNKDTSTAADYFIYLPNKIDYVVYDLKNPCAYVDRMDVEYEIDTARGIINSSLWNAMDDAGLSWKMISKMEDALAWSVDFYHIQKGDKFKLVYEKMMVDNKEVGLGKLLGATFLTSHKEFNAFYFEKAGWNGYYDFNARPMKRAFLKSPVEYGRISSRFNLKRRHPILKRVRPHLGTDYAAPHGTPIRSVASGTVTHVAYTRGNGNYVKVKHDRIYTTQYLHMSRFADGIKPGTKVSQGDVIGYVGSTGLATGPHVCYRFWKNGKQVDPLKQDLPKPEPMPDSLLNEFYSTRDSIMDMLDELDLSKLEATSS